MDGKILREAIECRNISSGWWSRGLTDQTLKNCFKYQSNKEIRKATSMISDTQFGWQSETQSGWQEVTRCLELVRDMQCQQQCRWEGGSQGSKHLIICHPFQVREIGLTGKINDPRLVNVTAFTSVNIKQRCRGRTSQETDVNGRGVNPATNHLQVSDLHHHCFDCLVHS